MGLRLDISHVDRVKEVRSFIYQPGLEVDNMHQISKILSVCTPRVVQRSSRRCP